jgi:hypothetical protein
VEALDLDVAPSSLFQTQIQNKKADLGTEAISSNSPKTIKRTNDFVMVTKGFKTGEERGKEGLTKEKIVLKSTVDSSSKKLYAINAKKVNGNESDESDDSEVLASDFADLGDGDLGKRTL